MATNQTDCSRLLQICRAETCKPYEISINVYDMYTELPINGLNNGT